MRTLKLFCLTFFFSILSWSQNIISGVITDESGMPLPGATVLIEGTQDGVSSDFDGNYTIEANEGSTLIFSFIGYGAQEVLVSDQSEINISLSADNLLDEVVMTGVAIGTPVRNLGFSIGKVSSKALDEVPAGDPASALRGKISGVRIVQSSGNPSSAPEIRLRGSTSISGSQKPLIIIDGIISINNGSLRDIAVEDIETIEVIKGAAGSSLYGSLAGNGVVQIITKKGRKNQGPKITLKHEAGFSGINGNYPLTLNHPYKTAPVATGDWDNDPTTPNTSNFGFDLTSGSRVLNADANGNTFFTNNYQTTTFDNPKSIFTDQPMQTFTGSISSGGENYNYYASFQQLEQGGILEPVDPYKRQSSRVNFNIDLSDKFNFSFTSNYVKSDGFNIDEQGQGANFFYGALVVEPFINFKEKDPAGYFAPEPKGYNVQASNFQNPLYVADYSTFDFSAIRFLSGVKGTYDFDDFLTINVEQTIDRSSDINKSYFPSGFITPAPNAQLNDGFISESRLESEAAISSLSANYIRSFDDFKTALTLKYLYEKRKFSSMSGSGYDFIAQGVINLENTVKENQSLGSEIREEVARNYFLNLDLDYKDKIIASGLIRYDQSSLFGVDNRSRVYGRGTAAYILSEDFDIDGIDFLKIRASYGTSGNRPNWYAQYETFTVTTSSITPGVLGNKKLLPSVTGELEIGFNVNFLQKFDFEFNFSDQKTKDDFILVPLPGVAGFSSQWQNVGEIQSTYYEASLNGSIIEKENMSLNFGLVFDTGTQVITDLGEVPAYTRSGLGAVDIFRVEKDKPYGTMYGYKYATSLDQLSVENGLVLNVPAGASSSAGGGISDYSINEYGYVIKTSDKGSSSESPMMIYDEEKDATAVTEIGNTNPKFNLGFTTDFTYKNFSFYTVLDYQNGGDIYNYTKQLLYFNERHSDLGIFGNSGKEQNYAQNIYNKSDANSHFVEEGSYLKVREISIAYNLNKSDLGFFGNYLDQLTVQVTGRNLFTFTNYSGWDPEVAISTNPTNFRLDEYSYPNFRSFSAAITLKF